MEADEQRHDPRFDGPQRFDSHGAQPRFDSHGAQQRFDSHGAQQQFAEYGLQTRMPKQLLSGIDKLEKFVEWPKFSGQVRMMLDASYPFIGNWIRAIASLDTPPTAEWMASLAIQCETSLEIMYHFLGICGGF